DDLGDVVQALAHHQSDGELLVAGGDDHGDVRIGLVLRAHQIVRGRAALPQQAARATDDEQAFAFAKPDNVTVVIHGSKSWAPRRAGSFPARARTGGRAAPALQSPNKETTARECGRGG